MKVSPLGQTSPDHTVGPCALDVSDCLLHSDREKKSEMEIERDRRTFTSRSHRRHSLNSLPLSSSQFAGIAAVVAAVAAPLAAAGAVELNNDNYDEMTAGKGAFIKFQAPW